MPPHSAATDRPCGDIKWDHSLKSRHLEAIWERDLFRPQVWASIENRQVRGESGLEVPDPKIILGLRKNNPGKISNTIGAKEGDLKPRTGL